MLLLRLDPANRVPQYRQIVDQIRQKIEDRTLRPGDLLPSTRGLANQLGIHRSTVAAAFHELWALGMIDLRPGARPRVRRRPQIAIVARRKSKGMLDWQAIASAASSEVQRIDEAFQEEAAAGTESWIDFSRINIDARLFPVERFRASLNRVMRERGAELLGYGDRAGFAPLRAHLAGRLRSHGIAADADEILITNGSQQAIDLVLRMIAGPERTIAVESPTYDHLLPLARLLGLEVLEVPTAETGMDLGLLADVIRRRRPSLVYTMPNFHNPTGVTTSQAHREELLALCESNGVPLLEDGFEEEMKYFGPVVLPLKSMDRHHVVIYCGTLSKVLFPGLRIGWVVADRECIDRLAAIRRFSEIAPGLLLQAAMLEFYEAGHYDRHVSRMHRVFRRRMQVARDALRSEVAPDVAEWTEPSGGFLIWLTLKGAIRRRELEAALTARGVKVAFGDRFFASGQAGQHVRISIASLDDEQIIDGVRRIAAALRDSGRQQRGLAAS